MATNINIESILYTTMVQWEVMYLHKHLSPTFTVFLPASHVVQDGGVSDASLQSAEKVVVPRNYSNNIIFW